MSEERVRHLRFSVDVAVKGEWNPDAPLHDEPFSEGGTIGEAASWSEIARGRTREDAVVSAALTYSAFNEWRQRTDAFRAWLKETFDVETRDDAVEIIDLDRETK